MSLNPEGLRVLITGGAGFIGSHLADRLLDLGSNVTVLDNFDEFYRGKEWNVAHNLGRKGYRLVRGDILDFELLNGLAESTDVMIHAAAQPGVQECNLNPGKAHQVNVTGTLNVLLALKQNQVSRLIYASSSSVYGDGDHRRMKEADPTNPTCPYGASKLAGEKYCLAFREVYRLPVVCLRYFSVYGPRGRPDQVLYRFVSQVSKGVPPIIFGDGDQMRDFTFIEDAVEATVAAVVSDDCLGEVINVGYGRALTIKEVAQKVIGRLGKTGEVEPQYKDSYRGDFLLTLADNSKARRLLGWSPRAEFDEGLDRFVRWFLGSRVIQEAQ